MMSNKDQNSPTFGDLREALEPVLRVLSQLGGHFTFVDAQGEQFVIARKTDFEAMKKQPREAEKQLPLGSARATGARLTDSADEVLDKINREIAMYQERQSDETDDLEIVPSEMQTEAEPDDYRAPMPPPVRVRFEPIKGDLPPELQE